MTEGVCKPELTQHGFYAGSNPASVPKWVNDFIIVLVDKVYGL